MTDPTQSAVYLGCDPDMACPTVAAVCASTGRLVGVYASRRGAVKKGAESSAIVSIRNVRGIFHDFSKMLGYPSILGIAIENQEVFSSARRGVPPSSLLALGQVAGAIVLDALYEVRAEGRVLFPQPKTWKGDVPKHIHQARVLGKLKIEYEKVREDYCVPLDCEHIVGYDTVNRGDWKHASDSVGLAVWCREELVKA